MISRLQFEKAANSEEKRGGGEDQHKVNALGFAAFRTKGTEGGRPITPFKIC
jgi:hypothetical protein